MLPAQPQAGQHPANAAPADPCPVLFPQVLLEQSGSPDRGVVAPLARVLVNDGLQPRIDHPLGDGRAPASGGIRQPGREVQWVPQFEAASPIIDGLAGNMQMPGDLLRAAAFVKEQ
jgi:hypothetical protein